MNTKHTTMRTAGIEGLGVALATPFLPAVETGTGQADFGSGGIDLAAFRRLVRYVAENGADFLVAIGSTGEGPTVLPAERDELIKACVEEAQGLPVVVGTGHNSTRTACELSVRAAELGADALLVVVPYYNKPQPAGIAAHFRAVARAARIPIIAYNVPGRTGINLKPADLDLLWDIPEVIAVKESSGNLAQIGEIARRLPEGRRILSGDDSLALPAIAQGASGLISVIGNVLPAETKTLVDAARRGDLETARRFEKTLLPLMDALFAESNPVPVKAALELIGLCSKAVRLPLAPACAETEARLSACIEKIKAENLVPAYAVPRGAASISSAPVSSASDKTEPCGAESQNRGRTARRNVR